MTKTNGSFFDLNGYKYATLLYQFEVNGYFLLLLDLWFTEIESKNFYCKCENTALSLTFHNIDLLILAN